MRFSSAGLLVLLFAGAICFTLAGGSPHDSNSIDSARLNSIRGHDCYRYEQWFIWDCAGPDLFEPTDSCSILYCTDVDGGCPDGGRHWAGGWYVIPAVSSPPPLIPVGETGPNGGYGILEQNQYCYSNINCSQIPRRANKTCQEGTDYFGAGLGDFQAFLYSLSNWGYLNEDFSLWYTQGNCAPANGHFCWPCVAEPTGDPDDVVKLAMLRFISGDCPP